MKSPSATSENRAGLIAVTGLSCRLPGDVRSPDDFWRYCCRNQSAWSKIPSSRFNAEAYFHPNVEKQGTFVPEGGHFLDDDVGLFDAPFFGITAEEAACLDPQQRLLLECGFEALENAGATKAALGGDNVGVFVAGAFCEYELNNLRDTENIPNFEVTGCASSFLSNRLSYFFNLKGPSLTVDTACSSSLTALHLACQSIRNGESSQALVGGANLNLTPEYFVAYSANRYASQTQEKVHTD
jgi:acyl transferase domain-containing protein